MFRSDYLTEIRGMDLYEIADKTKAAADEVAEAQKKFLDKEDLAEYTYDVLFLEFKKDHTVAESERMANTDERYRKKKREMMESENGLREKKIEYEKWGNIFQACQMALSLSKYERKLI